MRLLTRRVFVGLVAAVTLAMPRWFGGSTTFRDDVELVIVNGWIVRKSDLGRTTDDR